jgi:hypothetical protein
MKKFPKKLDLKFCPKRFTFFIFSCLAVIFIILRTPQNIDAKELLEFNHDPKNYNSKLQIFAADDKDFKKRIAEFSIAIADSNEKKLYGLMNLDQLPENYGMFFPFEKSQIITFWMKNTRIPLDMIFINENDEIVSIKTNATPYSLEVISSEKEAKKTLEINAGLVEKLGIMVGQEVKIL